MRICQRGMSRTFQLTALFPEMTARDNARLAAQARDATTWQPFGGVPCSRTAADGVMRRWSGWV